MTRLQENPRAQIEREFNVVDGIIRTPGKFEGEAIYVPYFYWAMLNGCGDTIDLSWDDENTAMIDVFHVTADDIIEFPELADRETVELWWDDNGFVWEVN